MLAPTQATPASLPLIAQQVRLDPSKSADAPAALKRVDPSKASQEADPNPARPVPDPVPEASGATGSERGSKPQRLVGDTSIGPSIGPGAAENLVASASAPATDENGVPLSLFEGDTSALRQAGDQPPAGTPRDLPAGAPDGERPTSQTRERTGERNAERAGAPDGPTAPSPDTSAAPEEEPTDARGLTEAEQELVRNLQARDREVKDHEEAHARVGGEFASAPSYDYQLGPDGNRYAIGGSVLIDTSPVEDDPEATINKMEVVKAAALAPAEPSPADRRVAALADSIRIAALAELNALRAERRDALSEDDLARLVGDLFKRTQDQPQPLMDVAA